METINNKKMKKEKCLLCGKLSQKYWVVAEDYDNLKPYHEKCRDNLVSMILRDAGMKMKTQKQNKTNFINAREEAEKTFRKRQREERKSYRGFV